MSSNPRFALLGALLALAATAVRADSVPCSGPNLDWYTEIVGETPCETYVGLRQICNPDFHVDKSNIDFGTSGAMCGDTNTACCCNSISWQLSLLCMNCLFDPDELVSVTEEAFPRYLSGCGAGLNGSLPNAVQNAVCETNVRIDDWFFDVPFGWNGTHGEGWDFDVIQARMTEFNEEHGGNTLTRCSEVE
ncbi:hypothetical protein C8Q80DRAFT_368931 [Daedaleopsis nitida]|nr:hypothetical protein C8Q80DRAFT_368931 [Daedaleopsis nitida]